WFKALQGMTKQIDAGYNDESRQLSSIEDASNTSNFGRTMQDAEADAKKLYEINVQGCRFDTIARYFDFSDQLTHSLTTGYSLDSSKVGSNDKRTPAGTGPNALDSARWDAYQNEFCDGNSNAGHPGCAAGSNPRADAHVLPSQTIFGKETIDMADATTRDAV